jgi:hypothetical protein
MNETNGQTCTTKIEECLYFGTERVRDRDIGCTRQDACRAVRKGRIKSREELEVTHVS